MQTGARSQRALSIVARICVATIGGYGFSYTVAGALSRVLPMPRAEAVILTAFVAIALNVVVALWAFASRSVLRTAVLLAACFMPLYAFAFWPR